MNENARNVMLEGLADVITHVSLHSGYPGETGTAEITGGSPVYARSPVIWQAADNGVLTATGQPSFDIPATATISWCGFWNSVSATAATNFFGSIPLGSGAPLIVSAAQDTNIFSVSNHPFINNQTVVFLDTLGSLPGGITEGTIYWVRDVTTTGFKVAPNQGGVAVDLLTSGVGLVYAIVSETYNQQGIHTFTSLSVVVS